MAKIINFADFKNKQQNKGKETQNSEISKTSFIESEDYLLFDDEQLISKIYLKEM